MKRNQGNVIILFVIILLTILIILLLSLKTKIQKGWNTSSQQPQAIEKKITPNETTSSQATTSKEDAQLPPQQNQPPILTNEKYEYYNDVSSIQNDETLNPFITSLNANPPKTITVGSSPKVDKAPNKAPIPSNPNQIKIAPNGFEFPNTTSYLMGYPIKNRSGKLNITISNVVGRSNLAVFVYLKKPYSEHKDVDLNVLTSAIYIAAGDTFTFKNVDSGYYRIVWLNLANKKVYRSKEFAVFQDNKYAYDRIFTFYPNNTHPQNKATQIPLNTLYKNTQ